MLLTPAEIKACRDVTLFLLKQIPHTAEGPQGSEVLQLLTSSTAEPYTCYEIYILEPLRLCMEPYNSLPCFSIRNHLV